MEFLLKFITVMKRVLSNVQKCPKRSSFLLRAFAESLSFVPSESYETFLKAVHSTCLRFSIPGLTLLDIVVRSWQDLVKILEQSWLRSC